MSMLKYDYSDVKHVSVQWLCLGLNIVILQRFSILFLSALVTVEQFSPSLVLDYESQPYSLTFTITMKDCIWSNGPILWIWAQLMSLYSPWFDVEATTGSCILILNIRMEVSFD